jgi:hypothetical protein
MCIVCPDVLSMVGETSYGIQMGFIESDKVITTSVINLFVFAFVQLINYQLCNLLLSLKLKNLYLGDITMSNLTYTAGLLECQHPTILVSMKISL